MFDWEFAILEALHSLGGEADLKDTYAFLDERLPSSGRHTKFGNGVHTSNLVRRHISDLCLRGYVIRQKRGRYSLTHHGNQRFVNELAQIAPESPIVQLERRRKSFVLEVEVEALDEGGFLACCPAIPGCHAEGHTVGESIENLEDAARTILELTKRQSWPMPKGLEEFKAHKALAAQIVVPLP
jgi:antitoxin HicB